MKTLSIYAIATVITWAAIYGLPSLLTYGVVVKTILFS
jgi:hypothetical protein